MKTVLIVGSVNMDYTVYMKSFPKEGETILGLSRLVQPGGKGENQAVAIARSNRVKTNFICSFGNDNDGNTIKSVLKENNVNVFCKTSECETGNATIFVDGNSENKIVVIPGANTQLLKEDIDIDLIKQCDYVVLQNEILQETNDFIIKEAHKLGKIVVYNPAPYRKFDKDLFSFIDYFIPNETELENYTNISDPIEGAKQLLILGVKNVIVTLGKNGSLFVNKDCVQKFPIVKVKAVDTVAAGDTFVGYFVASIASDLSIKESIKKATFASSITVSRKGGVISIPNGKDVY